jgi:signal transduction histidine kinase
LSSPHARRATLVVLVAAALHLAFAHLFLALYLRAISIPSAGLFTTVSLTVAVSFGAMLIALYLGIQYTGPERLTRTVPLALRVTPPLACALLLPVTLPLTLLEQDLQAVVHAVTPTFVSVWVSALLLALVVARSLHALAIRAPARSDTGRPRVDAPSLTGSYASALTTAAVCAAVVATGVVITSAHLDAHGLEGVRVWAPAIGLVTLVGLAAAAGWSLGHTPGRDLVSIAQRLDSLGHGGASEIAKPLVATSADEIGELLTRLEGLRAHLDEELRLYQNALDKTKAADALKADFLSAVSHELRTPLNVVGGFAQLLLENHDSPLTDAQAEDVRLIQTGGNQLLDLINDILDISMIESGDLRLHFSRTDIAELVEGVVRIHQPLVRDTHTSLESELRGDLPPIVCDRRRITQILTNLVSNAIKFTDEGSITVRVAFDPRSNNVVIRCIDTGVGIAPDELDSIFEEYRQVGSIKRRKRGTGLGLAIARSIASFHGGSLTVESRLGEGSTFTLTLPLDPPERPPNIDVGAEAARSMLRTKRHATPADEVAS